MKALLIIVCIIACKNACCQQTDSLVLTQTEKRELLTKSRWQKAIGWTILGTGAPVVLVTGGMLLFVPSDAWDSSVGAAVFAGSAAYCLISLPLLSAGRKNKQKAVSLRLMQQKIMQPELKAVQFRVQPALGLHLSL